ncbi:MAG: DUF4189 domain-containing protein [Patescibacteria group bacterium]
MKSRYLRYLIVLVSVLGTVFAEANERPLISIHGSTSTQGGPWYAIVLGKASKPGKFSGVVAADQASPQTAIEKATERCKKVSRITECTFVVVSDKCLFISVGTRSEGRELNYAYGATEEESLRKCAIGDFKCFVHIKQGCTP